MPIAMFLLSVSLLSMAFILIGTLVTQPMPTDIFSVISSVLSLSLGILMLIYLSQTPRYSNHPIQNFLQTYLRHIKLLFKFFCKAAVYAYIGILTTLVLLFIIVMI